MFNELPIQPAHENIAIAIGMQEEAKRDLERVISTLVSGFTNDETKSQELQRAFHAMSALTRASEMLATVQLQIQPHFVAKMPCSHPSHLKGHKLGI